MLIAADYPFMDVFWSMLIFFLWFAWLLVLFRIFADVFRRHDISGWGKALWCVFVIFLPFLGVLVYLIAEGKDMGRRDIEHAAASRAEFDEYIRSVASQPAPAGQGTPQGTPPPQTPTS
jgi:Phospholipase_D-nuclease N-terminal